MKSLKPFIGILILFTLLFLSFSNLVYALENDYEPERVITIGTNHIKSGQQSNIYFGRYPQSNLGSEEPNRGIENIDWVKDTYATKNNQGPYYSNDPVKWRVLKNTGAELFVCSDKNIDTVYFNTSLWEKSTVRSWLNAYPASYNTGNNGNGIDYINDNFIGNAFSLVEQTMIKTSHVPNEYNTFWGSMGGPDTYDKLFLLSIDQILNTEYGFASHTDRTITRTANNTDYVCGKGRQKPSTTDRWWLRTPGSRYSFLVVAVGFEGEISYSGLEPYLYDFCIRPAFKLNLDSVLFTSGTDIGYTLTFKDSERKFSVKDTAKKEVHPNDSISFEYENAVIGTNEYVSAVLTDSDDNVLKYEQLKDDIEETGMVSFKVPSDLEQGEYTLKLFNEKYNGEQMTNFSSDFVNIPLTVKAKPVFKIQNYEQVENNSVATVFISEPGNYSLIFVDFKNGILNDIELLPLAITKDMVGENKKTSEKGILLNSGDKVLLWDNTKSLIPLSYSFTIK